MQNREARVAQCVRQLDYLTTHTSLSPIRHEFTPGFVNYKRGCTQLAVASDKVYQSLAHGRRFSPGIPASSTTKTGRIDVAEILLKVALNTKNISNLNIKQQLKNDRNQCTTCHMNISDLPTYIHSFSVEFGCVPTIYKYDLTSRVNFRSSHRLSPSFDVMPYLRMLGTSYLHT